MRIHANELLSNEQRRMVNDGVTCRGSKGDCRNNNSHNNYNRNGEREY